MQKFEDMLITDEGEFFPANPTTDLGDKEDVLQILKDDKKSLEFGYKYAMKDFIAHGMMTRHFKYVSGHYQLPRLRPNSSFILPESRKMVLRRLDGLKKRLLKDPLLLHATAVYQPIANHHIQLG